MLVVICPHCNEYIEILELNCSIFRHGVYKVNFEQINPHLNKIDCDYLYDNDLIFGCGKPFKVVNNEAEKCDYL